MWKPLLLIVPLRLGISDINPMYIPALKRCLELNSSCGMIGGRPNQALYFLGYVDDEVLYLDPHTTQRAGCVGQKQTPAEQELDESYHQKYAARLNFSAMDPSLAVCFLCKTRDSFDELLKQLRQEVLNLCTPALFEISQSRAVDWDTADDIEWPTMPDIDWPANNDSESFALVGECELNLTRFFNSFLSICSNWQATANETKRERERAREWSCCSLSQRLRFGIPERKWSSCARREVRPDAAVATWL